MLLGAWELLVVAVAALLLLGPEKLPELMRTVARLVSQAQRLVTEAKQSVSDVLNDEHEHKPPTASEDRSRYDDSDVAPFSDWAAKADPSTATAAPATSASPTAPPPTPRAASSDDEHSLAPEGEKDDANEPKGSA